MSVLRMPYQDDELSMIVLLPDAADGLPDLEAGLDAARFDALAATLYPADAPIAFPRLELTYKQDLAPVLAALGMPTAFTAAADLTGIAPDSDLAITGVFHQAFVKVDEAGTEAAAATAVVVGETSAPMPFYADHPFLFVLRDDLTGTVLFVGRITDPS